MLYQYLRSEVISSSLFLHPGTLAERFQKLCHARTAGSVYLGARWRLGEAAEKLSEGQGQGETEGQSREIQELRRRSGGSRGGDLRVGSGR